MNKIDKFKQTQDYIDICYMIDHVPRIQTLEIIMRELGYQVGISIVKNDTQKKFVEIGKKNEFRVQLTSKDKFTNIARCAIVSNNKK